MLTRVIVLCREIHATMDTVNFGMFPYSIPVPRRKSKECGKLIVLQHLFPSVKHKVYLLSIIICNPANPSGQCTTPAVFNTQTHCSSPPQCVCFVHFMKQTAIIYL